VKNHYIAQIAAAQPNPSQSGQISISVEQILIGSAVLVGGATIGVVKWFVSRSIRQYEDTNKELKTEISNLKEEIKGLEDTLYNHQRTADFRAAEIDRRFIELSTHDQAYPLLGAVKDRFRDYQPFGRLCVKPMRLIREKPPTIPQMLDGFWIYIQEFEFDLLEV